MPNHSLPCLTLPSRARPHHAIANPAEPYRGTPLKHFEMRNRKTSVARTKICETN